MHGCVMVTKRCYKIVCVTKDTWFGSGSNFFDTFRNWTR